MNGQEKSGANQVSVPAKAKPEQGHYWCYKCRTFSACVFTFRKLMDKWSRYSCRNCGHQEVYYHYPKG